MSDDAFQNVDPPKSPKAPVGFFGVRHIQATLYFFMLWITFSSRYTISEGIVAMTDNTTSPNPNIPTYNWNDKNVILSSFFWGYILPQAFVGQLSRAYGSKWFLVAALLLNSLACMSIPLVAENLGSKGVMSCRILQGFILPILNNLIGKWSPTTETSRMMTITMAGMALGTASSMLVTGLISASWAGWPTNFYLFGSLGLVWVVAWIIFGANSPEEHKTISEEEKKYIQFTLGRDNTTIAAPCRDFLRSVPLWAVTLGGAGYNWASGTTSAEISIYFNKILNFDMNQNALLATVPYLATAALNTAVGPVADYLINSGKMSRTGVRKLFNSLGTLVPTTTLLGLAFIPDNQPVLSVVLLVLTIGMGAMCSAGFMVNHIDLSPNHAGALMGIINTIGVLCQFSSPLFVQTIVTDETDRSQWKIIFIVAACIHTASAIVFLLFASGDVQYWNSTYQNQDETQRKKDLIKS